MLKETEKTKSGETGLNTNNDAPSQAGAVSKTTQEGNKKSTKKVIVKSEKKEESNQ